jgi:hypothetical protein
MTSGWTGSGGMEGVSEEWRTCQSQNLTYNKVYLLKKTNDHKYTVTVTYFMCLSMTSYFHTTHFNTEYGGSTFYQNISHTAHIHMVQNPKSSIISNNESPLKLEIIQ